MTPMTDTTTSTTPDSDTMITAIDTHLEAYGTADAARRSELVASVWATDGILADPPIDGAGHDGITALGDVIQAHYAGHTFRRTTAVDSHHGVARYGWALVAPDGSVTLTGLDVAEFRNDGKLARIVGFFGDLAPV